MKLTSNKFNQAMTNNKKQLGLWISLSNNFAAEVVADAGYDWVLIDMEHSPNDYFSVLSQLQVFASRPVTAIVRPQWNDPVVVKRLLDLGVGGLLFPMIQNVEDAQKAVASTRYPPSGIRGVSGATRATKFGRISDYVNRIEQETTVLVQLESVRAVENAQKIAAVDGVTGVFFGPADIAADMGVVGQPMHEKVWQLIKPVAQNLTDKGVPVGTLVLNPGFAAQLLNAGFTYVACGIDTVLLANAADSLLIEVKDNLECG